MEVQFDEAWPVLQRTPSVVRELLQNLPETWIVATEGPGTWTPFDVVGHLIHGERADWIPRVEHILQHGDSVPFPAFDREAMFAASQGRSLTELLDMFQQLRTQSLSRLSSLGTVRRPPRRGSSRCSRRCRKHLPFPWAAIAKMKPVAIARS